MRCHPSLLVALVSCVAGIFGRTLSDDANDESALLQVSLKASKSAAFVDEDAPPSENNVTFSRNESNIIVQPSLPIHELPLSPSHQQSKADLKKEFPPPGFDLPTHSGHFFEKDVELEQMPQHSSPRVSNDKGELQGRSGMMYFHSMKELEQSCSVLLGVTLKEPTSLWRQSLSNTAHAKSDDFHNSKQELLSELEQARKRVATLESLLATSSMRATGMHDQESQAQVDQPAEPEWRPVCHDEGWDDTKWNESITFRVVRALILLTLWLCLAVYAVVTIVRYERGRDELSEAWFHNPLCLTKVIGVLLLQSVLFGMLCFTEFIWFTNPYCSMGRNRPLTTVEAFYQIVVTMCTIGYGDITPVTDFGCFFFIFYATGLVLITGIYAQHFVMLYFEMLGEDTNYEARSSRRSVLPLILCGAFGTLFYGLYPGEEKDFIESTYMTFITFLTIGYGDYHPVTSVGRFVGAIWMLAGSAFMGRAILDFSFWLYHHRRSLRSHAAAVKAFNEIDKTNQGFIDKAQFLGFELVQQGYSHTMLDKIFAKFDEFDVDNSGTLTFDEFKAYVDSIDDLLPG